MTKKITGKDNAKGPTLINSITKAVNILKCLQKDTLGVVQLAQKLDLNKVSVYRLLKTLESSGFVAQDRISRKYYLGGAIVSIARDLFFSHQELIAAAYPEMIYLRDLTGETVTLTVQSGTVGMILEQVRSGNPIMFSRELGCYLSLYEGASGKALLMQLNDNDVKQYAKTMGRIDAGLQTTMSEKELITLIRKARKQGYILSSGEMESFVAAIAVPIRNYRVPTALSVAGLRERWEPKMVGFHEQIEASRDRIENMLLSHS